MKDLMFDVGANDIDFIDGDFRVVDGCGHQNGLLILTKSCVDIMRPQYGVGLYEVYANMRQGRLRNVLDTAKRQMLDDGALDVHISHSARGDGVYDVELNARYLGD